MKGHKITEEDLLAWLDEMDDASLPTDAELEQIEVSDAFVTRMHTLIDQAGAGETAPTVTPIRKRRRRIERFAIAAVLLLIFATPLNRVLADAAARYIFRDLGDQFVIEHIADWEEEADFSNVIYEVPEGYDLQEEIKEPVYHASWRNSNQDRLFVNVSKSGHTHYDYEYATEMFTTKIGGVEATFYLKGGTSVLFGFKGGYLVDVSGELEFEVLKSVFNSIEIK